MAWGLIAMAVSASLTAARPAPSQPSGLRSDPELRRDLQTWLGRESAAQSAKERVEAIQHLAALYRKITRDPHLAARSTLRRDRAALRQRLAAIQRELERSAPRQGRGQALGAGGGASVGDYGPALVALIERTISPDSWRGQGGRGTVVYYRPGRALVVHATPEIHSRVGRLLQALRDAGR